MTEGSTVLIHMSAQKRKMQKTKVTQICFVPKGAKIILCNAIDRDGDGQLWETKSGKWIPIPIEEGGKETTIPPEEEIVVSETQ